MFENHFFANSKIKKKKYGEIRAESPMTLVSLGLSLFQYRAQLEHYRTALRQLIWLFIALGL